MCAQHRGCCCCCSEKNVKKRQHEDHGNITMASQTPLSVGTLMDCFSKERFCLCALAPAGTPPPTQHTMPCLQDMYKQHALCADHCTGSRTTAADYPCMGRQAQGRQQRGRPEWHTMHAAQACRTRPFQTAQATAACTTSNMQTPKTIRTTAPGLCCQDQDSVMAERRASIISAASVSLTASSLPPSAQTALP